MMSEFCKDAPFAVYARWNTEAVSSFICPEKNNQCYPDNDVSSLLICHNIDHKRGNADLNIRLHQNKTAMNNPDSFEAFDRNHKFRDHQILVKKRNHLIKRKQHDRRRKIHILKAR